MIVVKVGGSLYDHPALGPGLRAYLDTLAPEPVLLVPGGGDFGDAVRKLDAVHGLGEEAAHRLALRSLAVAGEFVADLLSRPHPLAPSPARGGGTGQDGSGPVPPPRAGEGVRGWGSVNILDCFTFCDSVPDLPHSWAVTTDSIAAAAAIRRGGRLVLLKSLAVPPDVSWAEAAARGWVDGHFPALLSRHPIPVEVIDFRRRLDSARPPG